MDEFELDLRAIEEEIEEPTADSPEKEDDDNEHPDVADIESDVDVELGVLDGTTEPTEWVEVVESGRVLFLSIEGDVNELAAGFARDIYEAGGELVHFRGFLVVAPPGIDVDTERLK